MSRAYGQKVAEAAIKASETKPSAMSSGSAKRLRKAAGMPKKEKSPTQIAAEEAIAKGKREKARKAGNMIPEKREKSYSKKAQSNVTLTTPEMKKRRAKVAAEREKKQNPGKAELMKLKKNVAGKVSSAQRLMKAFGLK